MELGNDENLPVSTSKNEPKGHCSPLVCEYPGYAASSLYEFMAIGIMVAT